MVPGPGQYAADSAAVSKNIAYTFGLKCGSSLKGGSNAPGPGQYNPDNGFSPRKTG